MVEFHEIIDNVGRKKLCVKVTDIKNAPENSEMYPYIATDIDPLSDAMAEEYELHGIPNYEEIEVCEHTGYVLKGNNRNIVGNGITKADGTVMPSYEYLYAQKAPKGYDEMSPQERANYLQEANTKGKRNEYDVRTIVKSHNYLEDLHEKSDDFVVNQKRWIDTPVYKNFLVHRRIEASKLKKLVYIGKQLPELLTKIEENGLAWSTAYKQACGVVSTKLVADPHRFPFLEHFDKTPKIKTFVSNNIKTAMNYFNEIPLGLKNEFLLNDDQFGFEKNQITSVLSNIINSVTARAYTNYADNDFKTTARTGRVNQKSDQGKSRPDIVFPELSKGLKKYQDEKLEVKACSFNPTPSKMILYGGPGARMCTQHEYLIGIWTDDCQRLFLMLATLDPEDWTATGKHTQEYSLPLNKWCDNHFKKKDFRIIMGDLWMDRGRLNIAFDKIND